MFCVVWYRRCWWWFESLADQHKWERTQTISGKKPTEPPFLFPARLFSVFICLDLLCILALSSCHFHFCPLFACFSITVTVTNRLLCFSLPDVAVPQQDSSRLCLRGLLLPHCHCGSFYRQQVPETWKENFVSGPPKWFLFHELLIKSWIFSIGSTVLWPSGIIPCPLIKSLEGIDNDLVLFESTGTCVCGTLWWLLQTALCMVRCSTRNDWVFFFVTVSFHHCLIVGYFF